MSAANSAFLLILAIAIAMMNISSSTTWGPGKTCRNQGVDCPQNDTSNCEGVCVCKEFNDPLGKRLLCMDPPTSESSGRSQ
uniref:Putative tick defensin n=1 Tax=Rhipicephalus pulchellus TaxID=72859 RepID=L7MAL4_RHIPC